MTTVYIKDGKEFASEWELRQAHPELIFPELSEEVMKMIGVTKEEREDPAPTDEEMSTQIREHRDALLAESDYYMTTDYPATEQGLTAVKAYRQALRDITKQDGFPKSVTWPEVPNELESEEVYVK